MLVRNTPRRKATEFDASSRADLSMDINPLLAFRRIKIRDQDPHRAAAIEQKFSVAPAVARILAARRFTDDEEVQGYLHPTLKHGLPEFGGLRGLTEVTGRLARAIQAGEKIAISCDFDVDGLSGGAQLLHFLRTIGVKVKVFVPNRFEHGYGLNSDLITQAQQEGFSLMVAIDFGTTNAAELQHAKKLGLDTIVIDHHHADGPPPCDLFINPQQSSCGFAEGILCSSGLVWYLIASLWRAIGSPAEVNPKNYLDLASLGTICDMVPLQKVNRVIAKRGLEVLNTTTRVGLVALREVMGLHGDISSHSISFGFGPRINAAGRVEDGTMVVDLLTTEDSLRAKQLARRLNRLNAERQEIEESVKRIAVQNVLSKGALPDGIVVWDESFHTGVVGIVAQRVIELFYRPTVILGAEGKLYKGSVRGVKGFHVADALTNLSQFLEKFGGHAGAGGLTIHPENLAPFADAFAKECRRQLSKEQLVPYTEADTSAELDELSLGLIEQLRAFEPFGIGNPGPILLFDGLTVREVKVLKEAHLKVMLHGGTRVIAGLLWRTKEHPALYVGAKVRIAAKPEVNEFRGDRNLQLIIQAVEAE